MRAIAVLVLLMRVATPSVADEFRLKAETTEYGRGDTPAFSLPVVSAFRRNSAPAAPKPPGEGGPNRPPVVRARCEPCSVPVGQTATVTADARDPDGNRLKYRWSAPAGSLKKASKQETTFTAPMVEGPVFVSVRVDDRKGGIASDVITIQVTRAPAP